MTCVAGLLREHGGQLQPHAAAPRTVPAPQLRRACAAAPARPARGPAAGLVCTGQLLQHAAILYTISLNCCDDSQYNALVLINAFCSTGNVTILLTTHFRD